MIETTRPNKLPGRFIVAGYYAMFLCLFCSTVSLGFLHTPSGRLLATIGEFFGFLWVPLVVIGVVARLLGGKSFAK